MAEEPFFLVNEFLEKEKKELENVLDVVHGKNQKSMERATFLRNFTNEMFKVYRKTAKPKVEVKKYQEKQPQREELLRKKLEVLKKLQQLQQKTEVIKVPEPTKEKDIILSKETGKSLVKTEFNGTQYFIKEPDLNEQDINLMKELKNINLDDKQKLVDQLKALCAKSNIQYTDDYYDKMRYYLVRDFKRYGKISPLVEDKDVEEIVCDGNNKPITITHKGKEDIQTSVSFASEEELNKFILKIAEKANQKVSVENPFLNTTLDRLNIQATLGSEFVKAKFIISKT